MATLSIPRGHARSRSWLSGLNFFLADVRDGLGPFLGILLASHGWRADDIGYVMAAGGVAGMLATTPMGAWIDASRHKRLLLASGTIVLTLATAALWTAPSFGVAVASQVVTGSVGALIGAGIMGITLGIVDQRDLSRQLGINEAWNHAGNVVAAALAGLAGYRWGLSAVFVLMALMACAALACLWKIHPQDINHERARGGGLTSNQPAQGSSPSPSILRVLTDSRELGLLAITMLLFHLGNAAMLPLFAQSIVTRGLADPSIFTASTVIVAQLVMIPVALWAGWYASRHGYRGLIIIALLALPFRGLIAGFWESPWALIPVQALDGIGAGLLGVALPGLVACILRRTGHVNAGLGAVMAIQGIGAAMSHALAGWIAHRFGYSTAFVALGIVAAIGLLTYRFGISSRAHPNSLESPLFARRRDALLDNLKSLGRGHQSRRRFAQRNHHDNN
ncbi:MFS transporter [Pseudomonas sp. B21-048]|uniref:MFS transporter n=1 Tax=Pseudomonas sp. B21-048 TaxID=2895490 RepID=UPI0021608485|nr:MFS transporter [Pseudomonas sp. B21-048]UVK96818.1 MFS transporter [Pseudomonas sp. B21-048]